MTLGSLTPGSVFEPDSAFATLLAAVADAWPAQRWRDVGVVVGCSGGADSVALVAALCHLRTAVPPSDAARGFLVVAHFNHGLRADRSDADESFVSQLADQRQLRSVIGRSRGESRDEATMRKERLAFLTEVAHTTGARYVSLAHSADDNVETVLHHLMRGTGPAGLAGIGSPTNLGPDVVLIRPLLKVRRDLIRQGLTEIGQPWREDESNADASYKRNWIRHRLIPLMESEFPSAVPAIARAIDGQRGWRAVIDELSRQWISDHLAGSDNVQIRRDATTDPPIVIAALQAAWSQRGWPRGEMSREHWNRLANTIAGDDSQRYLLPGEIEVRASNQVVEIRAGAESS